MKSADHDIVIKINGDLARDSSLGAKMNAGYEYSNWYYVNNGHDFNLEHQRICAQKTIDRLGLDVDTAVKVQNAVIHAYQMADQMLDVREVIQRVHLTASQAIQGQMLDQVQNLSINVPPVPISQTLKKPPAHKRLTDDNCIVDIGGGNKAIDCSGIQSKHSKDTSIEGVQQISQAVCNVLSLKETKDKNPYITNNIKVIDLSNCNINGWDTNFFSSRLSHLDLNLDALYIQNNSLGNTASEQLLCYKIASNSSVTHTLRHIDLSNCNLGYNGAIHFSRISEHWHRLESANLSNNVIDDRGAMAIANAFFYGKFPQLKGLDFHGNKISAEGYGYFAKVLETVPRQIQTQDIAVTLEVHAGKNAVIDFLKKGSSYYFQEFVKNFKNNIDTQYIKTDENSAFMHCKKGVPNAVVGVTLGVAKCTNPIAKIINSLPQSGEKISFTTKAVNKLGLFACIMSEEGDNIVTPDLLGCASEIHEQLNDCVIF